MDTNHNRIKVSDLEKNESGKILTTNTNGELEFTNINTIKVDGYNALDYNQEGKVLDARQGKVLKDLIDNSKDTLKTYFDTLYLGISNNQNVSGIKTFLAGKLGLRNTANTFTSFFSNTNTASRTYTFQDKSGTVADLTDLAGKMNVPSGVINKISKFSTTSTIGNSRITDDGTNLGIDNQWPILSDFSFGSLKNRRVDIENSESQTEGRSLILAAGKASNTSFSSTNFVKTQDHSYGWSCIDIHKNGDTYACIYNGDIYKKTAGTSNFIPLGQTARTWHSIKCMQNGDVYACGWRTDIYKQTAGTGDFMPLGQAVRTWNSISQDLNGDIYAVCLALPSAIFKQTAGVGDFVLWQSFGFIITGLDFASNGDAYLTGFGNDIHKKVYGASSFGATNQGAKNWFSVKCAPNGDVYAGISGDNNIGGTSGDVYKKTAGTNDFIALGQTTRSWRSLASNSLGDIYAATFDGIFHLNLSQTGAPNLNGGALKLIGGTGKGSGTSEVQFFTGQKTVSGADMQTETLRAHINENGYMIWANMPTYADNVAAIAGGLPVGCEYKTTTGDRKIVY
ncbi:hypothetical protein [Flavobacterium sp. FlaQc-50]|uniref:hypothetical protein n=1 Tax=unclassified Flavobacterium TaxID=196869 RepID=UPI0037566444